MELILFTAVLLTMRYDGTGKESFEKILPIAPWSSLDLAGSAFLSNIGDSEVKAISESLNTNTTLTELDLRCDERKKEIKQRMK